MPASTSPRRSTFLLADVRGYIRYTQEHGDEAASRLTARFASTVRAMLADLGGELVDLRGVEALCVFASTHQDVRASVDLALSAMVGTDGVR
jgi:class 3 adenylate cyclase